MIVRLLRQDWSRVVTWSLLWWLVAVGQFNKFLGPYVTLLVLPIIVALSLAYAGRLPGLGKWMRRFGDIEPRYTAIIAAGVAVLAFAILYPIANSHVLGQGTDRNDALDRAVAALLAGHNPYAERTYLGQPITELPGAFLLALPFHAMGTAALQNPFWLVVFFLRLFRWFPDSRNAATLSFLILINPGVMQDYVVGSDYLTDAIIVFLAADFALDAHDKRKSPATKAIALVFLALSLSIHPIYWIVVPILALHIRRQESLRSAMAFALAGCILLAAINLPFYLHDPASFGPLSVVAKAAWMPAAFWILPVLSLCSAFLVLGASPERTSLMAIIGVALAIMLVPPVFVTLAAKGFGYYSSYLLPVLLFLGLGWFPVAGFWGRDHSQRPAAALS